MKKLLQVVLLLCLLSFGSTVTVDAKILTEPELKVYVDHNIFEEGTYYLDILVPYSDSITRQESTNPALHTIYQFHDQDGFYGALAYSYGIQGEFTGESQKNRTLHYFRGELPETFKIIVAGMDGSTVVSELITAEDYPNIETYSTVLYFNVAENTVSLFDIQLNIFAHVFIAMILLIVIKGFILIAFNYDIFKNLKVFISTNIVLLLILNILVTIGLYYFGFMVALYSAIMITFVIMIIEGIIYAAKLEGPNRLKNVLVSLVGNVAVLLFSILFMIIA